MQSFLMIAFYAVVFVLAVGAAVNAFGPLRAQYKAWGYPENFRFVTAALEALAVGLMLYPPTRAAGLLLAALIMVAAVATLVRAKEYAHAIPAVLVLGASASCLAWQ